MKNKVLIFSIFGAMTLCILTLCILICMNHTENANNAGNTGNTENTESAESIESTKNTEDANICKIDPDQVETITVGWYGRGEHELNEYDAKAFIRLYNKSSYGGKATGEGGTPYFGVLVNFVDGTHLRMNDFNTMGHEFEAHYEKKNGQPNEGSYYVDSPELYKFVLLAMLIAGQ